MGKNLYLESEVVARILDEPSSAAKTTLAN